MPSPKSVARDPLSHPSQSHLPGQKKARTWVVQKVLRQYCEMSACHARTDPEAVGIPFGATRTTDRVRLRDSPCPYVNGPCSHAYGKSGGNWIDTHRDVAGVAGPYRLLVQKCSRVHLFIRWTRSSVYATTLRKVTWPDGYVQPILGAIERIVSQRDPYSCSRTIRTARSRTSADYRLGFPIAPSSQEMEPPGVPGRLKTEFLDRLLMGRHQ